MEDLTQQTADKVTLGKYQFAATATDEEGREGRWVFHRPTLGEMLQIGALAEMLKTARVKGTGPEAPRALELPDLYEQVSYMVATLNVVTDLRPSWAPKDFSESYDFDLILDLFKQYEDWVSSFRRDVREDGA